jgi:branched-subunit amino acid aminotransferase/4-amino-4-deoxychorismate lyase
VKLQIPDTSAAILYGKGVFTTIAILSSQPFLWEKHWLRLSEHAQKIGIDLSGHSEEATRTALDSAICDTAHGKARITFYDNRATDIWPTDSPEQNAVVSILVGERRPVPRPFRCFVSPRTIDSGSPLAGIKSCNYLDNILAIEDARRLGFNEAIRLNELGHVAGACMANVFWLADGRLFTPSLSTGCLAGTTREFVLENLECDEVETETDAFLRADAVFLTSAGLGVIAVDEFDGRELSASDHPILHLVPSEL